MRSNRFVTSLLGLMVCCWGIWSSARAGIGELLSYYGSSAEQMLPIGKAADLDPADPDVHLACAMLSLTKGGSREAARALERAVQLRPRHYYLWQQLGSVRDQAGDAAGARDALEEAVRLAPHYAQPRWQLGNVLLRLGLRDEAFTQLRQATASDPTRLAALVDLAWGVYGGDAGAVQGSVDPQSDYARMILARFFAKKGQASEALSLFRASSQVPNPERRSLVTELLAARSFPEAYEVWSQGRTDIDTTRGGIAVITNGGFEDEINFDDTSFGWRLPSSTHGLRVSLDSTEPRSGKRSLRIDFAGGADTATPIVSQLILVQPNSRYTLGFAARTRDLATGGPPVMMVTDVSRSADRLLAVSKPLAQESSEWQDYAVDFATGEETRAVLISLRRQDCTPPCPVVGQLWLDDFSIKEQAPSK